MAIRAGRSSTLGVPTCAKLPFFVDEAGPFTAAAADCTVYSMKAFYADTRGCAWPFRMFRSVLTAWDGYFLVHCVPPAVMCKHEDIHVFLSKADGAQLSELTSFVLRPRSSIFVAQGWTPVFYHISPPKLEKQARGPAKKKPGDHEYGSIVTHIILDPKVDGERRSSRRRSATIAPTSVTWPSR